MGAARHYPYTVRAAESGDVIEGADSYEEGVATIAKFEQIDREEGTFTEGFYELYDEDNEHIVDIREAPMIKKLVRSGNSLMVNVTKEAELLKLERGSLVVVTLRKY